MFLEIKDLKKFYGEKENRICVLKGVNLSIEEGSIVVILGPSGSGKSTILNIIGGLEVPDNGTILINGKKIDNMKASNLGKYRRDMIGFIFQSYNLIPNLTVKENIELCQKLGDKAIDIDEAIGKMADKILKISGGEIAKEIVVENPLSVDEIEW